MPPSLLRGLPPVLEQDVNAIAMSKTAARSVAMRRPKIRRFMSVVPSVATSSSTSVLGRE
jgi:ABC-type Fe3+-siderophore transport system permease subunit